MYDKKMFASKGLDSILTAFGGFMSIAHKF